MDKLIDPSGYNAVVKGRYGYTVYNRNDIFIGRSIERYGEFSEAEVELFKQICKESDIVVEVGANIGTHTMALSGMVGKNGRIYAFEPQRIVFQTLCANMALNCIENVECFQMAVSCDDGFVQIPDIRYDLQGNFGGVNIKQFEKTGVKTPMVALDNFLYIPRLKFLKIDVEGMEHEVIRGATKLIKEYKPVLYVENDRLNKSKELIELIWSLDYRLFWHQPPLFSPNNFSGDPENIFPGIISLNMLGLHKSVSPNMEQFEEVLDSDFHPLKK